MIDYPSTEVEFLGPAVDSSQHKGRFRRDAKLMNLKSQLRFYLDKTGMTAVQLSKATGVSKQVISLWLGGGSPRKLDQVKMVAGYFKVSIDHLCYGKGELKTKDDFSMPNDDEWVSGKFEVKFRRIK